MAGRGAGRGRIRRQVDAGGRVVYQAEYTDASGLRHRRNLAGDRSSAERALAKIIRDRDLEISGLGGEMGLDLPVSWLVGQYVADLAPRARPRTISETVRILGALVLVMGIILVRDVTRERVHAWRLRRSGKGASNKTINNALACLMAALNLAVSLGQLAQNPIIGLRTLPISASHQRRRPRALTELEIGALLEAAARYDSKFARGAVPQEPLLLALIATGARWSEMVSARWADLDEQMATLTFRAESTKTQSARTIPLADGVLEGILRGRAAASMILRRAPHSSEPIFLTPKGRPWSKDGGNFRRFLHVVMDMAGVEYRDGTGRVVHIHAMRHTFATRLGRAGVPVATAMRLTGHASVQMLTQIYQHASSDDARDAIRSLPALPRSDARSQPVAGPSLERAAAKRAASVLRERHADGDNPGVAAECR